MKKTIVAAAVAAVFAAPAMADVKISGAVQFEAGEFDSAGASDNRVKSDIKFSGSEDLGNGMKAIFQMEFGVPISTGAPTTTAQVNANRNSFVGLAGDFGTFLVGRHDAPHSMAWGYADPFVDTVVDFDSGIFNTVEWFRADGAIAYVTPNFNGLTAAIASVPDETTTNGTNGDGIADHVSAMVKYSNGGLTVAGGYWSHEVSDMDEWNLSAQYKMDAFAVSGIYYVEEEGAGADDTTWQISASYTMGNNTINAMYRDMEIESNSATQNEAESWAIGLDHKFSKRTKAQVIYTANDIDNNVTTVNDGDVFSMQLNHSF